VQVGKHIEQVLADLWPQVERKGGGSIGTVEHDSVDEAHDVERCAVHRRIGAQSQRLGHRHHGLANRRDDAVLAGHVVGRGKDLGEWRAAQHESPVVGIGHGVCEIGSPAGDQGEPVRRLSTGDVGVEPSSDPTNIDALHNVTP
jgi:hypothetical protein